MPAPCTASAAEREYLMALRGGVAVILPAGGSIAVATGTDTLRLTLRPGMGMPSAAAFLSPEKARQLAAALLGAASGAEWG